ncbi:MAG: hypothetical protein WCJ55_15380 [Chloroflexales bacterium]
MSDVDPTPDTPTTMERLINLVDNLVTGQPFTAGPFGSGLSAGDLADTEGLRATVRAMQGMTDAGWFGIGARPATIADLVGAMRRTVSGQQDNITAVIDQLKEPGLSDTLGLVNTVANLFSATEEGLADGSQLMISTAGTIGTVAMLGALGVHMQQQRYILQDIRTALQNTANLERLIRALDGGNTPAPANNVLSELEAVKTLLS